MHRLILKFYPFALAVAILYGNAAADAVQVDPARNLRAKYATLADNLRQNHFGRPIHLQSVESEGAVKGEIYALFDYPFEKMSMALNGSSHWCDILMLPVNSKACRISTDGRATTLSLGIGNKDDHRLDEVYTVQFSHRVSTATTDYFAVQLLADAGPLGTNDYRILVEAVAVAGARTFLHFSYSYSFGLAARLAMQAYLSTAGRSKVGFTVTRKDTHGKPVYVGGMLGVIERNSMRYYLAIEAFLETLDTPPINQLENRLSAWFESTEQYPRQLREVSRAEYLNSKLDAYRRQRAGRWSIS